MDKITIVKDGKEIVGDVMGKDVVIEVLCQVIGW